MDLEDFDNGTAYAHYGSFGVGLFSVDPEEDGYPLTVADYSGTAGEILVQQGELVCRVEPLCSLGSGSRSQVPRGPHSCNPMEPGWFTHFTDQRAEPRAGARRSLGLASVGPLSCR